MITPPSFSELLNAMAQISETEFGLNVPQNWLQGRTTYGGLSAAICLRATQSRYTSLPPLRSAQINFIGPVSGNITVEVEMMREGRSVSYISAKMMGEKGLASHAIFCFGAARESRLDRDFTETPTVPSVQSSLDFFQNQGAPAFANHYECKLAIGGHPVSGSDHHEHYIWVRHKDPKASDMAALLGIADMPPPAVLPMFKEFSPISSMNWMLNFLTDDITTENGWWLMRSAADHARDGYSSQDMQVWNSRGDLVISALQNVAVFY